MNFRCLVPSIKAVLEPLDDPIDDCPRELSDEGVLFAAWSKNANRLYTGGSDGVLKAWDVKQPPGKAFVRNVLTLSGGITAGAFCTDGSQLIIGDSTGKAHLLGIGSGDFNEDFDSRKTKPVTAKSFRYAQSGSVISSHIKRPKVIIPHSEPPPPAGYDVATVVEENAQGIARGYIEQGQLRIHPHRTIGAVQGVNYRELGLHRLEAHEDNDAEKPLLPEWEAKQLHKVRGSDGPRQVRSLPISTLPRITETTRYEMTSQPLDMMALLTIDNEKATKEDRVELDWDHTESFDYDMRPRTRVFRGWKVHVRGVGMNR